MNQRNILVGIIIALLLVIGIFVWQNNKSEETKVTNQTQENSNQSTPTSTPSPTATPAQPTVIDLSTFEKSMMAKGKNWTLTRVTVNNKNANMDVKVNAPLTLQFDTTKKTYSGFAGCNNFSGTYTSSGSFKFDFGATASTKMACPALDLETEFFKAMNAVSTFGIKGDQLVFTSEDGFTELLYNQAI